MHTSNLYAIYLLHPYWSTALNVIIFKTVALTSKALCYTVNYFCNRKQCSHQFNTLHVFYTVSFYTVFYTEFWKKKKKQPKTTATKTLLQTYQALNILHKTFDFLHTRVYWYAVSQKKKPKVQSSFFIPAIKTADL